MVVEWFHHLHHHHRTRHRLRVKSNSVWPSLSVASSSSLGSSPFNLTPVPISSTLASEPPTGLDAGAVSSDLPPGSHQPKLKLSPKVMSSLLSSLPRCRRSTAATESSSSSSPPSSSSSLHRRRATYLHFLPEGLKESVKNDLGKPGRPLNLTLSFRQTFVVKKRSVGIGLFVLCSRIGGVIVPFILLSGESWSKYPMMIFAALSVLASLMLLPLPEMMGMPQPQTPDDVKRIRKISRERKTSKASKAQPAIIDV